VSAYLDIGDELQKVGSLITTARRLLATGTMVDLSALEGKVRAICEGITGIPRETALPHLSTMETLIADLDRLSDALRTQHEPVAARIEGTGRPGSGAEG
jgi:hypothetical protein